MIKMNPPVSKTPLKFPSLKNLWLERLLTLFRKKKSEINRRHKPPIARMTPQRNTALRPASLTS